MLGCIDFGARSINMVAAASRARPMSVPIGPCIGLNRPCARCGARCGARCCCAGWPIDLAAPRIGGCCGAGAGFGMLAGGVAGTAGVPFFRGLNCLAGACVAACCLRGITLSSYACSSVLMVRVTLMSEKEVLPLLLASVNKT